MPRGGGAHSKDPRLDREGRAKSSQNEGVTAAPGLSANDSFVEGASATVISTNAPLRTRPWQKTIAVILSVLLAFTMFDFSAIGPSVSSALASEETSEQVASEDADSSSPSDSESEEGEKSAQNQDEDADKANSENASAEKTSSENQGDSVSPSEGDDDKTADYQENEPAESESVAPSVADVQAVAISEEDLKALAPVGLTPADQVLPADLGGEDDIRERLTSDLAAWGAPFSSEGSFQLKGRRMQVRLGLGNLKSQLNGGFMGGSAEGDAVVLTFDAPYLYPADEKGTLASTLSAEEWAIRVVRANEAKSAHVGETAQAVADRAHEALMSENVKRLGGRVALYREGVPEGWSAWQLHQNGYARLTDDDFKGGVSGRIVFRYEGGERGKDGKRTEADGRLDADAAMPQFEVGFAGSVIDGGSAALTCGYEVHSYTDADGKTSLGTAMRQGAGSLNLSNVESTAEASLAVEPMGSPTVADGQTGWASHLLTLAIPEHAPAAQSAAFAVSYPADAQGKNGLTAHDLRANRADGNKEEKAADGETEYVGIPGESGLVVLDVTGLSADERATIDPTNAEALEAAGLICLPYQVTDEGRAVVSLKDEAGKVSAGGERVLLVSVPFASENLTLDGTADKSAYQPVRAVFEAQPSLRVLSSAQAFPLREEADIAFARKASVSPAPDQLKPAEGDAAQKPEGDEGDNAASNEPTDDNSANEGGDEGANAPAATEFTKPALPESHPGISGHAVTDANGNFYSLMMQSINPDGNVALYAATDEELLDAFSLTLGYNGDCMMLDQENNIYMVGSTNKATVSLDYAYTSDLYILGTPNDPANIYLEIPYFYRDVDGTIQEVADYNEYCGILADPAVAAKNPDWNTNPMRMMLTSEDMDALFESYDVYSSLSPFPINGADNWKQIEGCYYQEDKNDPESKVFALTGVFRLCPKSFDDPTLALADVFDVAFTANVPENTGGAVKTGCVIESYIDVLTNEAHTCGVVIDNGTSTKEFVRSITFIKSNLQWEMKVTPLTEHQVMWDRYNYHAYKVEIENTSPTFDTPIDLLGFNLTVPNSESGTGGILRSDIASWKADGTPVSADELYGDVWKSGSFIGKPNAGGVLIYDVTDQDTDAASWNVFWDSVDQVKFTNVESLANVQPLAYQTFERNGQMNFLIQNEKDANGELPPLLMPTGNPDHKRSKVTLLVAAPFTTNLSYTPWQEPDTKIQRKTYPNLAFGCYPTVYFGNRGIEGFTWSKSNKNDAQRFEDVFNSVKMRKIASAYDAANDPNAPASVMNEPKFLENGGSGTGRLGYPSHYRLTDFTSQGNIFISGIEKNCDQPSNVVDSLPKYWDLSTITLRVKKDSRNTASPSAATAAAGSLEQWFGGNGKPIIEVQVCTAPIP